MTLDSVGEANDVGAGKQSNPALDEQWSSSKGLIIIKKNLKKTRKW